MHFELQSSLIFSKFWVYHTSSSVFWWVMVSSSAVMTQSPSRNLSSSPKSSIRTNIRFLVDLIFQGWKLNLTWNLKNLLKNMDRKFSFIPKNMEVFTYKSHINLCYYKTFKKNNNSFIKLTNLKMRSRYFWFNFW